MATPNTQHIHNNQPEQYFLRLHKTTDTDVIFSLSLALSNALQMSGARTPR